jgi:hypothetical protein
MRKINNLFRILKSSKAWLSGLCNLLFNKYDNINLLNIIILFGLCFIIYKIYSGLYGYGLIAFLLSLVNSSLLCYIFFNKFKIYDNSIVSFFDIIYYLFYFFFLDKKNE